MYPRTALTDGTVALRRWLESDLDCVREAARDPEIPRGTTVPARYTPAEGRAFIRRQWGRADSGEGVSLAVAAAADDRAIGLVVVLFRPQPGVAGLGYWVVPSARGAGMATRAVRLVAPWALASLRLNRLEAWVYPDNVGSQRVLRKAGFSYEGRLRNFLSHGDGCSDALVFSRIP